MIPYAEQVPNYKFVEQLGGPKATNSYINSIMSFLLNNQRSDKKKQQYHTIALPALHELTMGGPGEPNQSEKQPSPLDFNLSRASLASQGNSPRLVSPRYPGEEPPFPRQEVGAELGKRAKPGFDSESLLLSRQAANPKKLVLDGYSFEGSEFNGDAGLNANSVPPSPDASFRAFDLFQDQPESPSRLSRDEEFTPKEPLDLS